MTPYNILLQIGYPLRDLPNVEGFRFRGVELNGDLMPCRVIQRADGLHEVVCEKDESPAYDKLRGWMQWLPPKGYLK